MTSFPIAHQSTNGRAIGALGFGVLGLVFPVIPAVLAIWLGVTARRAIRDDSSQGGGWMATSGIILGVLELVFVVFAIGLLLALGLAVNHMHGHVQIVPQTHIQTVPQSQP